MKKKSMKPILAILALMTIVSAGRLVDVSEAEETGQTRQEANLSSQNQEENKDPSSSNQGENDGEKFGTDEGEKEKLKQVSTYQANNMPKVIIPKDPKNPGETPKGYVRVKLVADSTGRSHEQGTFDINDPNDKVRYLFVRKNSYYKDPDVVAGLSSFVPKKIRNHNQRVFDYWRDTKDYDDLSYNILRNDEEVYSAVYKFAAVPSYPEEVTVGVNEEIEIKPTFKIDGKPVEKPFEARLELGRLYGIDVVGSIELRSYDGAVIFRPLFTDGDKTFNIPVNVYYPGENYNPYKLKIKVRVKPTIGQIIEKTKAINPKDFAAFEGTVTYDDKELLRKGIEIVSDPEGKIKTYVDEAIEIEAFIPNVDTLNIDYIFAPDDKTPSPFKRVLNFQLRFKDFSLTSFLGRPNLYIWKKKTINTPENKDLPKPDDAVQVSFKMGEGIKSLDPSDLTMTVQSGEELVPNDFPEATIDTDKGYGGDVEWVGNGEGEGLVVSKTNNVFTAVASQKPEKPVEPEKQYATLTFDANGGKWENKDTIKTLKVEKGKKIKILEAPKRVGYKFLYWEGSEYMPGDEYEVKNDHTFKAKWKEKAPFFPGIIPGVDPDPEVSPEPSPEENPKEDFPRDDKKEDKEEIKEEIKEENQKDEPSPEEEADQKLADKYPVVIPKDKTGVKDLENLDIMEKALVISKVEKVNPKAVDVMIDNKGNVTLIYADGSTNFIPSDKLVYLLKTSEAKKQVKDKKAANNPKTAISSLSFLLGAMAVAGAGLFVTNKKK